MTSRKCTVNAARIIASPRVRQSWTATTAGNQTSSAGRSGMPCQARKPSRMGSPKTKWHRFDTTVTTGRISTGNTTFLIRSPLTMSTPALSFSDEENHVHGRRPQNRKTA